MTCMMGEALSLDSNGEFALKFKLLLQIHFDHSIPYSGEIFAGAKFRGITRGAIFAVLISHTPNIGPCPNFSRAKHTHVSGQARSHVCLLLLSWSEFFESGPLVSGRETTG